MCLFYSGASANRDSNVKVKINPVLLLFSAVFNLPRWFCQCESFLRIFFSVFSSSLQFCGPQKMSRVCDLHLSWLCDRPQARCEQMCQRIHDSAFTFTSLLLSCFPLLSRLTASLSSYLAMRSLPVTRVHDSSVNPYILRIAQPHILICDVCTHVMSSYKASEMQGVGDREWGRYRWRVEGTDKREN